MHNRRIRRAFTVSELLVTIIAMAILLACTLAMVQDPRDRAGVVQSMSNLRNLMVASVTYAAEWNDRQFTLVSDHLARYGDSMTSALQVYNIANGAHPSIVLGEYTDGSGDRVESVLDMTVEAHQKWLAPISFDKRPDGGFRAINVRNFNQYVNGRFFDRTFYAPKDTVATRSAASGLDAKQDEAPAPEGPIPWSSYSFSPAAMYHPEVLAAKRDGQGGFSDPFSINNGFRSPSMAQTLYPDLKTSIIEHHWLQNRPAWANECNEQYEGGRYDGCEPHYFNHYAFSEPACAFVDGHIEMVRVTDVLDADARVRQQSGQGLWHRTPGGATDGYYESHALDPTRSSFHIFTTDGIRGRDTLR